MRPAAVSSRLIVTPTASTTYTVTATAQWEAGDPVRLYGGNLAGKWILIFSMLLGRLEIYTIIVLLMPAFWRK